MPWTHYTNKFNRQDNKRQLVDPQFLKLLPCSPILAIAGNARRERFPEVPDCSVLVTLKQPMMAKKEKSYTFAFSSRQPVCDSHNAQ